MENNLNDMDWEGVKEYLEKEIAEAEEHKGLADEQRAIIKERLKQLEEADDPLVLFGASLAAFIMLGWLKLGFLPSQLPSEFEFSATFFRMFPASKADNAPSPSGVSQFWDGIISQEMYDWENSKSAIDLSLNDPFLPSWIQVTALQLKAWHHVRLQEYDKACETLEQLRDNLSVSKSTVDYLMGYIKALEDSGRGSLHYELHYDVMFMMVPEAAPGELLPEKILLSKDFKVDFKLLMEDILKPLLKEQVTIPLLLSDWKIKEEIIGRMPITQTLGEVGERLRSEYGGWVNSLANQGALINAEFLYKALSARSWGGVIVEYANAVEAEIKTRLLPQLEKFFMAKGFSLESILPKRVDRGDSELGYAEAVLRQVKSKPIPTKLLSSLPSETFSFLLDELPDSLARLRNWRKPSAHGDIVGNANEIRKLVLKTPEKPGLLRRLNEINF